MKVNHCHLQDIQDFINKNVAWSTDYCYDKARLCVQKDDGKKKKKKACWTPDVGVEPTTLRLKV